MLTAQTVKLGPCSRDSMSKHGSQVQTPVSSVKNSKYNCAINEILVVIQGNRGTAVQDVESIVLLGGMSQAPIRGHGLAASD